MKHIVSLIVMVCVLTCSWVSTAYAYIDPGTGSYLFQLLMAGLLSSLFAVKMAWRNIKVYMSRFFSQDGTRRDDHE